jgi:hypothetical protein
LESAFLRRLYAEQEGPDLLIAILVVAIGSLTTAFAASKEEVLHSFNDSGTDGYWPEASPTMLGGAYGSGCSGCGSVFELAPGANGTWTEIVLYNINGTDGSWPSASLIFDSSGTARLPG